MFDSLTNKLFPNKKRKDFFRALTKNNYIPTHTLQLPSSTIAALSNVTNLLHGLSNYHSSEYREYISTTQFDYIENLSIVCYSDSNIYSFSTPDKCCYVLYSENHKDDYFKYYITFEKKSDNIIINSYIGGKSNNCTREDFQANVPDLIILPPSPATLTEKEYVTETEEELDFYRILNEHIRLAFAIMEDFIRNTYE